MPVSTHLHPKSFLCALLLLASSCSKDSDVVAPTVTAKAGKMNTIGRDLPCVFITAPYGVDVTQPGAWVQKTPRYAFLNAGLLDMQNYASPGAAVPDGLDMVQTKYMITPSGRETSVWEGILPVECRPTQPVEFRHEQAYSECGKAYSSKCVQSPTGQVVFTLQHEYQQ